MPIRLRSIAAIAIVLAGLAACAGGFEAHRMWTQLPSNRFGEQRVIANGDAQRWASGERAPLAAGMHA